MDNLPVKKSKETKVNLPLYREKLEAILNDCYAKNIIEMDEFEARLDKVHAAKTTGELEVIVDDLPEKYKNMYYSKESRYPQSTAVHKSAIAVMSEKIFRGASIGGSYTKVISVMADCTIDLRNINFLNNKTKIELINVMSDVTIIVPEKSIVFTECLSVMSGHTEGQGVNRTTDPDALEIRVTGKCVMANISIRTG